MMKTTLELKPKQTVLITGAAGGLGKAFAVECARRGWDLWLTDRTDSPLENLKRMFEDAYHVKVHTIGCDLGIPNGWTNLVNVLRESRANISMLINVAGVDFEGLFLSQPVADLQTMVRLNVESPLALMHEVIKLRIPNTKFRVINVSSLAAFYPMPVKATYAASKRFLLDLSRALNMEFQGENAMVTALCPAGMPTNRHCIQSIDAQGWAGYVTTMNTGRVAFVTIEAALKGKTVVVPGMINRIVQAVSTLLPTTVKMKFIARRWISVRISRIAHGELSSI
jgi:hypothetical protein